MTGDPDIPPLSGGWQAAGDVSPAGSGAHPPAVEARFSGQRRSRRGVSSMSVVAGVCGLLGLFLGPFLVADTPDRYLVFVLDVVALAMGGVGVWAAFKFRARVDWAVLGILTGGLSLGLYVVYVIDPPPVPAGGT